MLWSSSPLVSGPLPQYIILLKLLTLLRSVEFKLQSADRKAGENAKRRQASRRTRRQRRQSGTRVHIEREGKTDAGPEEEEEAKRYTHVVCLYVRVFECE